MFFAPRLLEEPGQVMSGQHVADMQGGRAVVVVVVVVVVFTVVVVSRPFLWLFSLLRTRSKVKGSGFGLRGSGVGLRVNSLG